MKNNFKRAISYCLVLLLIFSLTGCKGDSKNPTKDDLSNYDDVSLVDNDGAQNDSANGQNPNSTSGINTDNSNTSNSYTGNSNKGKKTIYNVPGNIGYNGKDYSGYDPYKNIKNYRGTTVKFATWINHLNTEAADALKSFEKKYGIKVELVYCSQANYASELLALITAGLSPDVYVDGAMFPFTSQIAQDFSVTGIDLNEPIWSQSSIHSCSVGRKVYAVDTINSVWRGTQGIVYNRELMEANGIKTPDEYYEEGNWTWETMRKCMQDVSALGKDYFGGSIPDVIDLMGSYCAGPVSYDYQTGKFKNTLNSENTIKTAKFVAELYKDGLLTDQKDFNAGKVGMIIKDPYAIKVTGYYHDMDPLDLAFTYLPNPDKNTKASFVSNIRGYGIVKGSKNPVAGGLFIRYFLDPANYDMNKTFLSEEVAKVFFKMNDEIYKSKSQNPVYYNYSGVALTTGDSAWNWVSTGSDPSQVATLFAMQSNKVDAAVSKANQLVDALK